MRSYTTVIQPNYDLGCSLEALLRRLTSCGTCRSLCTEDRWWLRLLALLVGFKFKSYRNGG